MALKTVFAVLLVVCLTELAWSSPSPLHSRRSTNDTSSSSSGNATSSGGGSSNFLNDIAEGIGNVFGKMFGKRSVDSDGTSSSSNVTTSSNDTSSDFTDNIKDNVEGFFGHLFGKRELKSPGLFDKLYEEWVNGRSNLSVTLRDTDNSYTKFLELSKEWLKKHSNKRSVTV